MHAPLSAASPFGKRLRPRRPDPQSSSVKETGDEKAEFQGFKLRRTTSQEQREKSGRGGSGYDFGVKLRVRNGERERERRERRERGRDSWGGREREGERVRRRGRGEGGEAAGEGVRWSLFFNSVYTVCVSVVGEGCPSMCGGGRLS